MCEWAGDKTTEKARKGNWHDPGLGSQRLRVQICQFPAVQTILLFAIIRL